MTETSVKCARCNEPVSSGSMWGLCARCLYVEVSEPPKQETAPTPSVKRFGDYELGEVLGRGGMAVVYSAKQSSLHRTVALKMILESEAASPVAIRRFTLEAEAAAKLDHPNIVPIYDVGEQDGQSFLSMKLIRGDTLRKKIHSGELCLAPNSASATQGNKSSRWRLNRRRDTKSKLPHHPGEATLRERAVAIARLMAIVARAVHHAHQNGVLHRDLKPGNILVDRDGQPHLTDFGLAKLMDLEGGAAGHGPLTVSGTTLGTPSYMSPEQASGHALTARSDIYSLGAILYEMLAGRPPFQGATVLETMRLAAEELPTHPCLINSRVDRELGVVCMKCLEKNPAARYATAEALAEDLERWLRQEPIRARPAGIAMRTRRWVVRNPVGAALILSLCAGLAAALVLVQLTLARQHKLDLHRANTLMQFSRDVEQMWNDAERPFVPVRSSELAELANLPPRPLDAVALHLTFALNINQEPFGQARQYAPFLAALENRLSETLKHPVFIDLRLYKSEANSLRDAARGQVDILRMGALQYVGARGNMAGLEPIVRERSAKQAVLFASKQSGITNMAQVAGRRVAFGQRNSTISFWAKAKLARAGILSSSLQSYSHINGDTHGRRMGQDQTGVRAPRAKPGLPGRTLDNSASNSLGNDASDVSTASLLHPSEDRDSETQAHKQVIQEVVSGRADVGVAPWRNFELSRNRRGGLVPLLTYSVESDVYVARPGMEAGMVRNIRESFLALRSEAERKSLGQASQTAARGFDPVQDGDFNEIRNAATREIADFESGAGAR